ncbi:hypothetical protein BD310DRAFT_918691 [Dichomitus squalens]|uniref:Uncharacterized protein n=1 Tax=Dichomitus squalens TaxID=114155 RepID=A0A4Q9Q583_9APHY|nr:hypothetical protein BD310DRAFT_918691 [Dichomitus squalens]
MLIRLSSSLPSTAAFVSRTAVPSARSIPSCARFNSSEAAAAPQQTQASSDGQPEAAPAPKKRAIPLAESLGNISVLKKKGQKWNRGPRPQPREGEGGVEVQQQQQQQQHQRPRSLRPINGPRRDGQAYSGPRPQQDRPRNRDQQGRPAYARPRPVSPRQWGQQDAASAESQESKDVAKPSSAPSSSKLQPKVLLGDLKELFGPPAAHTRSPIASAPSAKNVTPSQARVQLLLEKAAGDYSRYAPKPYLTTDVGKLGPLKLAEFTLSHNRAVPPKRRSDALTVVEKFVGKSAPQVSA